MLTYEDFLIWGRVYRRLHSPEGRDSWEQFTRMVTGIQRSDGTDQRTNYLLLCTHKHFPREQWLEVRNAYAENPHA